MIWQKPLGLGQLQGRREANGFVCLCAILGVQASGVIKNCRMGQLAVRGKLCGSTRIAEALKL